MGDEKRDHWSSEKYQHSASFVPKLAGKVMEWLDPQPDDVILDIGCGDGVLDLQMASILARGSGRVHGIDSSPRMIQAAEAAVQAAGTTRCTFQVCDATDLAGAPELQRGTFTKAFSNAAMHWILRREDRRAGFFGGVRAALAPGAAFAFEMGGLGNVSEVLAALAGAVGRRVGVARAAALSPWFFPDEAWARAALEAAGGWRVDAVERVWRPTPTDEGGVEGWVRLMAAPFFEALPPEDREPCIREVVDVLEVVCRQPDGGYMLSYVRLRVLATAV